MNNRKTALIAFALVAGLLTGCGQSVATAPVQKAPAQAAARAAADTALPTHLIIDDVIRTRTDDSSIASGNERITIKAHSDKQKETLVFSSFFPYYIPMYGTVIRNGRTVKLDQDIAVPLDKLLHDADTSKLSQKALGNLNTALYGLDFVARRFN
ncbi:MAG: hypothetical protein ACK46X_02345 [Candidatus Sericytochromatia bacterium]